MSNKAWPHCQGAYLSSNASKHQSSFKIWPALSNSVFTLSINDLLPYGLHSHVIPMPELLLLHFLWNILEPEVSQAFIKLQMNRRKVLRSSTTKSSYYSLHSGLQKLLRWHKSSPETAIFCMKFLHTLHISFKPTVLKNFHVWPPTHSPQPHFLSSFKLSVQEWCRAPRSSHH